MVNHMGGESESFISFCLSNYNQTYNGKKLGSIGCILPFSHVREFACVLFCLAFTFMLPEVTHIAFFLKILLLVVMFICYLEVLHRVFLFYFIFLLLLLPCWVV